MMALVMLELGFTPDEMTGLAVLSTLPGVIAHVSEELASGRRIRTVPDDQVDYTAIDDRATSPPTVASPVGSTPHLGEGT